eukprot:gb/GECG01013877.1/.p1 GENE.gb/GECG01013877.1/~~gb/GECG01013877.1/.p1  ORF type:complete len:344 (+),score=49.87 gb/GECG01013877.1/:1-1032(+)
MSEGALLGMGNPLLDISAEVPDEVMKRYDVQPNNAILAEEKHMPLYKELIDNYDVRYIAGGATQNSIRVAQWMSQTPGFSSYIGCIGKDGYGQKLKDAAAKDGVKPLYMEDESAATGTCAVLITNKERSLVANLSAANNYKIDHFKTEPVQNALKKAQVIYTAGFFLTVSPDTMVEAGKLCAEHNKTFMMNLSAPFLCSVFKEQMHQVLPYADVVFGNESEAQAFAENNDMPKDSKIEDVALKIASLTKVNDKKSRMVVITQGSESTVVAQDGKTTTFPVTPMDKNEIVDLNGAGDAFVGGFLSQYALGRSVKNCVEAGHYAAGVIIRTSGCVLPDKCDFKPE